MGSERAMLAADAAPRRVPLTVRDFLLLDQAGAFDELGKVELVQGNIFRTAPLHRPHGRIMTFLRGLIDRAVEALGQGLETLSDASAQLDRTILP